MLPINPDKHDDLCRDLFTYFTGSSNICHVNIIIQSRKISGSLSKVLLCKTSVCFTGLITGQALIFHIKIQLPKAQYIE